MGVLDVLEIDKGDLAVHLGGHPVVGIATTGKLGILWPRKMESVTLMAEMPVWILALGQLQEEGSMGMPLPSR